MVQAEIAVLAANLARLRRQKKLTQAQVAARSGVHCAEISRIEHGRRDLRLSTLVRLARALNVKPGRLLERS